MPVGGGIIVVIGEGEGDIFGGILTPKLQDTEVASNKDAIKSRNKIRRVVR
jgi:hypothetical protein